MAAYAALVSLMNDLEFIPNHPIHYFSFDHKQIASLFQTVHFLIDFMDTYDSHGCTRESAQAMESRIAAAAHAAHDVIESHVVDQIHAGSTLDRNSRHYFFLDLQKAIDNVDFVKRKAMQFKAKSGLKAEQLTYSPPASSLLLTSVKSVMVGFDAVAVRFIHLNQCSVSAAVSAMRMVEQESLGNHDLLLEVNFCEKEQLERFQRMVQEECLTTNNLHLSYDYNKIKVF